MMIGAVTARMHRQTAIAWSIHDCERGSGDGRDSDDERMGLLPVECDRLGGIAFI